MYMPSKRLDLIQEHLVNNPFLTLANWKKVIADLTAEHGEDTVLYTDSGDDKCAILLSSDSSINQNITQDKIVADPSMTLKQWKECVANLTDAYGEKFYLYTDAGAANVQFYVSPIDTDD